ncbi:MAG: hypothetical protein KTR31_27590 [Myxococcales bacterium]|nr:hypothetical protein [Myxococcales bacterium]
MRLWSFLALAACAGGVPPVDVVDPETGDTGTTRTFDRPESASIVVELTAPWVDGGPSTFMGAFFLTQPPPVANLAQCVGAVDPVCIEQWPEAPGKPVSVLPGNPKVAAGLATLNAGRVVEVGPWTANRIDNGGQLFYFLQQDSLVSPPLGAQLNVRVDGSDAWPPSNWPEAIQSPTPMVVLSHDPAVETPLYDSDPIQLRWLPGDVGEVHLITSTPQGIQLEQLVDDGAHDVDLTKMGLDEGSRIDLRLGRWSRSELDVAGRSVDVSIQGNQRIRGVWNVIGPRDDLTDDLSDTCAEAEAADPLGPGFYEGNFTGFANDLNPGTAGCTDFAAVAADAILPFEVLPEQELVATYTLLQNNASVYLVTDCNDVLSCVAGADESSGINAAGTERLAWRNDGVEPQRVYLVLDGFDTVTHGFRLEVDLTTLGGDALVNDCADAIAQGPAESGLYDGTLIDHINLIPTYKTCGSIDQLGGEGMIEIFLESGRRLTATAETPGGTPVLHLLSNCSIADSCFASAVKQLEYSNSSPFDQTFYLVLDSGTGIGEYTLQIEID